MPTILNAADSVLYSKEDGIVTLTINRPKARNAFNLDVINKLINFLQDIAIDQTVRVVILVGAGAHFCAGADLAWMQEAVNYSQEENIQEAKIIAKLLRLLNNLNKPTICVVQGSAFAGALGLIACCDLAIALEDATFCLSEVRIGLAPAVISPYVIAAIGAKAARRWMLTAEPFTAVAAYNMGLVHIVVTTAAWQETLHKYTTMLCRNGPSALTAVKNLIADVVESPKDESLDDAMAKIIARLRASAEGQEGLASFLEKRQPKWDQKNNF